MGFGRPTAGEEQLESERVRGPDTRAVLSAVCHQPI